MRDIHSHILFGVDDGAQSIEESTAMLSAAKKAGFEHIVATPHVKHLPYDMEFTQKSFEETARQAQAMGISMSLGFELHWHVLKMLPPEQVKDFCFDGTQTLLIEFSMRGQVPENMVRTLRDLQRAELELIIAHPERYEFVQKNIDIANQWAEMGIALQLDACELCQSIFSASRLTAQRLLQAGLYDYAASDAHSENDYRSFAKVKKKYLFPII